MDQRQVPRNVPLHRSKSAEHAVTSTTYYDVNPDDPEQRKYYQKQLTEWLRLHDPKKLEQLDDMLAIYRGNEHLLLMKLQGKVASSRYGFEARRSGSADPQALTPSRQEPSSPQQSSYPDKHREPPTSASEPSTPAIPKAGDIKKRVVQLYIRHNPSKLPQVDQILKQWRGQEEALWAALVNRYAPEEVRVEQDHHQYRGRSSTKTTRREHSRPSSQPPVRRNRDGLHADSSSMALAQKDESHHLRRMVELQSAELRRLRSELRAAYETISAFRTKELPR